MKFCDQAVPANSYWRHDRNTDVVKLADATFVAGDKI